MEKHKKPIVFFEFAMHFGGSNLSTLLLIREMRKYENIAVVDAYGCCRQHLDFMSEFNIPYHIVQPNARRTVIGGSNFFIRAGRVMVSSLEMLGFIKRLRSMLLDISPRAIWVNSYKALRFLTFAVGDKFPIALYVRVEGMHPRWYVKRSLKKVSLIVGNSESCVAGLSEMSGLTNNIKVIPNGIDIDEIVRQSKKSVHLPEAAGLKLLFPGTLNKRKNQETAIRGLAEFVERGGDATLFLAGDYGPDTSNEYAQKLPALVRDLNVENKVYFLGWRDDVPALMRSSDIVVLTSLSEGMPRVLLEAMALGKPVLATNVSGIPELVRDCVDGILIEPENAAQFADALEKLSIESTRHKMGKSGAERIKSDFDIKDKANTFLKQLLLI